VEAQFWGTPVDIEPDFTTQQTSKSQKKPVKLLPKDVAAIKASTVEQEFGK
jgi:hypothetical protein